MRKESNRAARFKRTHADTRHREGLERRWSSRLDIQPEWAPRVTAQGGRTEPFHRWLRYRQGFSPELVRCFLGEHPSRQEAPGIRPVLDPFCGSGTTVIECARHGVAALGIEAAASLVFLAASRFESPPPDALEIGSEWTDGQIAASLKHPLHRAALMFAEAGRRTTAGRQRADTPPLRIVLLGTWALMAEDLKSPLPRANRVTLGDARKMADLEDASIGGILTSPPYLARYDYPQILQPLESLYRFWFSHDPRRPVQNGPRVAGFHPGESTFSKNRMNAPTSSARGSAKSAVDDFMTVMPDVVVEVCDALRHEGRDPDAHLALDYFSDLFAAIGECHRVLASGAPCWMVLGGARVRGVYVPTDMIAAEFAESCGLQVERLIMARNLIESGRKLGRIKSVRPRESILVMKKP